MYLLDANVFIEAKNRYFGFDTCPGYWEWIQERNEARAVFSIDAVRAELLRGNDQLTAWVKLLPNQFFLSPESETAPFLSNLAQWANDPVQQFRTNAISEFLGSADYLLVAQAKQRGFTVVTHELPDPNARKRIVIPEACKHLGVHWISPIELTRREGLRLVLDRSA